MLKPKTVKRIILSLTQLELNILDALPTTTNKSDWIREAIRARVAERMMEQMTGNPPEIVFGFVNKLLEEKKSDVNK